jgi:hypothetical protein
VAVLKWLTVALCVAQGGFIVLDGTRALATGDYITPSSGKYAGQLGPWAQLVSGIGISPHSTGIKLLFVTLGAAWIATSVGIALESSWAWLTGVIIAAATLWYLIPGTIVSAAILIILLATPLRATLTRP